MAELVLSLCDLLEAEGRLLRQNVRRTGSGCALAGIGLVFIAAALAFLVAAIYKALSLILAPPLVMLILGCICAMIAAIFFWSAKKCLPKTRQK